MTSQTKPSALIVDDSASARATFAALMEKDFDLIEAATCRQAFAALRTRTPPAVVLCDYQLEDGVGTEVLRELAERHPLATAMLVTAHGSLELALESINGSLAHRFVQKGASLDEMKAAIEACLSEYRQRENRLRAETSALNDTVAALVESICIQEPRVRRLSARLNALVQMPDNTIPMRDQRDMRIAALVLFIGLLKVPMDIVHSVFDGTRLGDDQWRQYRAFPDHTIEMIQQFPKLRGAVRLMSQAFVVSGDDRDDMSRAAGILRVHHQAVWLIERFGCSAAAAILTRDGQQAHTALEREVFQSSAARVRILARDTDPPAQVILERTPSRMLPGDVLLEDVFDPKGKLLLARGGKLNRRTIDALKEAVSGIGPSPNLKILRMAQASACNDGSSARPQSR